MTASDPAACVRLANRLRIVSGTSQATAITTTGALTMTETIGVPNGVIWFDCNPDGSKVEMACLIDAATVDVLTKGLDLAQRQLARAQKNGRKGTTAARTVASLTQILADVRAGSHKTAGEMFKSPEGKSRYAWVPKSEQA